MTTRTADDLDTLKAHIRKHLTMLEELQTEMRAAIDRPYAPGSPPGCWLA
ncbi:MAG: hypothetical protein ABIJ86_00805 [Spirochaetota bacterium]